MIFLRKRGNCLTKDHFLAKVRVSNEYSLIGKQIFQPKRSAMRMIQRDYSAYFYGLNYRLFYAEIVL